MMDRGVDGVEACSLRLAMALSPWEAVFPFSRGQGLSPKVPPWGGCPWTPSSTHVHARESHSLPALPGSGVSTPTAAQPAAAWGREGAGRGRGLAGPGCGPASRGTGSEWAGSSRRDRAQADGARIGPKTTWGERRARAALHAAGAGGTGRKRSSRRASACGFGRGRGREGRRGVPGLRRGGGRGAGPGFPGGGGEMLVIEGLEEG